MSIEGELRRILTIISDTSKNDIKTNIKDTK